MRLRLHHHRDGARVAYREAGTGPPLVLLHSLGLSHREWEPVIEPLAQRFRVIAPDLPLHGDSEDRPWHAYDEPWMAEVLAGFCAEVAGPRPLIAAHGLGADLALAAMAADALTPARLVLLPCHLGHAPRHAGAWWLWRVAASLGTIPGLDLAVSHAAGAVVRPGIGRRLSHSENPAACDLIRHAVTNVPGNANRARAWAKFARRWPTGEREPPSTRLERIAVPTLLLWAEADPTAPLAWARAALGAIPDAHLRTIPDAGFLVAYDEPVELARELIAFLG